jgi:hypothetical protein
MLLEYTMSCEDCRDQVMSAKLIDQFGHRLGEEVIQRLYGTTTLALGIEHLSEMMDVILNSMGVNFQKFLKVEQLSYELVQCPIHEAARKSGLNLWVVAARQAFIALCNHFVLNLAPDWTLVQPSDPGTDDPLDIILFSKK